MMEAYKTFEDLIFEDWGNRHHADYFKGKQAVMNFPNGYGVSVLFGECFYSNGIDTYELAVLHDRRLCYSTPITDDVLGRITKDEVTEAMIKIQKLPKQQ